MDKILLLSASAGAGHVRAADALLNACRLRGLESNAEHWDMLKYTNRVFRHLYGQMYLDLVNTAPAMLGLFYDISDTPYRHDKMRVMFEKLNSRRFLRSLRRFNPTIVVCTHFTPAAVLSWLVEKGESDLKPTVVVTDLDCHAMWLIRHYQRYFVARTETKRYLTRIGVPESKVDVTGIPIDPLFEKPLDKIAVRHKFGLDPNRFTILVSAGGYGVGPVESIISELLQVGQNAQVVAIAGRSAELKDRLEKLKSAESNSGGKLTVVGYTTEMDQYMAAADILIGKAGGLTTSEALARGLPICIVNPIPGQEERNSDHLLEEGAAIRCNNLPALAWKIDQLVSDPARFEAMKLRTLQIARPDAARSIVESILGSGSS